MWIPLQVSKVSRIHPFSFWPYHVQWQNKDYSRLAKTQKSQEYSIFFKLCKFLLPVHLQLLRHCHFIDTPHPEGHSLEVWLLLLRCFQLSQENIHLQSSLIGFLMLNSLWKLMPRTMLSLQSSLLLIKIMNSGLLLLDNRIYVLSAGNFHTCIL